MGNYAKLSSRTLYPQLDELDIFLTLQNPLGDPLTIDWTIKFPFPVVPTNKASGASRLDPYSNAVVSWTTDLARISVSQKEAASDQEIVVDLRLPSAGNHFLDGIRGTLKQLSGL